MFRGRGRMIKSLSSVAVPNENAENSEVKRSPSNLLLMGRGRKAFEVLKAQNTTEIKTEKSVTEITEKVSTIALDGNLQRTNSVTSIASEVSVQTNTTAFLTSNDQLLQRPDKGGKNGRSTQLESNFYEIEIDYTKGAFHYDVDIVYLLDKPDGTKTKIKAKKDFKCSVMEKIFLDNNLGFYVFDGEKNIYVVDKIDQSKVSINFQTKIKLERNENEKEFLVKFQLVSFIDLKTMKDYIEGKTYEVPRQAIHLLNLAIRQNKLKTHRLDKNSLFDLNAERKDLGNGLYYVIGQYMSIKACRNGWMQNCDMDSATYFKSLTLDRLLAEFYPRLRLDNDLTEKDIKKFEHDIRGLMVKTIYTENNKQYKILGLTKLNSSNLKFEHADLEKSTVCTVSVAEYFEHKYGALRYPNLPCVKVGSPSNPIFLPLEACKIVDGQRFRRVLNPQQQKTIAKGTVLLPNFRAKLIDDLLRMNVLDEAFLKHFGIKNCKKSNMCTVDARVLKSPCVLYRNNKQPLVRNGAWRLSNDQKFYNSKNLENWIIIWITEDRRLGDQDLDYLRQKLTNGIIYTFNNAGLPTSEPMFEYMPNKPIPEVFNSIRQNCRKKPQLVLFVFNEEQERNEIKKISEQDFGLMTQCVKYDKLMTQINLDLPAKDIVNDKKFINYLSCLVLKVNAKLGGINNLIDTSSFNSSQEPIMFFGADVSHQDYSSMAAVVGSLDLFHTSYAVQLAEQVNEKSNRKTKEIISDFQEMSFSLINMFKNRNDGTLPTKIIYYRDGVDEGQFESVIDKELAALRKACERIQEGYKPKVTIIIVQKRHHIRFFPLNDSDRIGRSGNIPAGSCIDTGITALNQFDFVLCSHETLQGTAQPTHYWVIHDENSFSSDDMQNLTFSMCHLYVKSTKSVSIPAPVYYAHLAALRGRIYSQFDNDNTSISSNVERAFTSKIIKIHPALAEKMFFA